MIQQIFLQKDWEVGRFLFPDAVLLHAQRSADRAGFGSSIRTGIKRYGETGQYLITGATLRRVSCEGRRHSDKNTRARCKTLLAEAHHETNRGFGRANPEFCLREAKNGFLKGAVAKCIAFCNSPF